MKILIIEENVELAEKIMQIAVRRPEDCEIVRDGETGIEYAESQSYDLIVIDRDLPGQSGIQTVKMLRESGVRVPVCMLTDGECSSRIEGLDRGADYCLSKPVDRGELHSVIYALLRREGGGSNIMSFGNTSLDTAACCLKCEDRTESLTATEFEIMRMLLRSGEDILSKTMILDNVWGLKSNATDNYVEVYIAFIRKKLQNIGSDITIQCVRRLGYRLQFKISE